MTGGGGGIGAAVAMELGRAGWHVVTVDPLVSVDGTERLTETDETTAGRILAAGGSAEASPASVTDGPAIEALLQRLQADRGRLDAVVNVAGISRPTGFARGTEEDWRAVLEVHLDGYLNVLRAALPLMAAAAQGRIVGVTSGSGWRPADAGAYGRAKRAVAALTWQLGHHAPPGVTVNAISPIANTRMVAGALARAPKPFEAKGATGGLSLASMPAPEDLGPIVAHLAGDGLGWCNGHVIFTAGSEVAVVGPPKLIEVVATEGVGSLEHVLDTVLPGAFVPAEAAQLSPGGSNARFASSFSEADPAGPAPASEVLACAVIGDRPDVVAALQQRGITCHQVQPVTGFDAAAAALAAGGPVDAVVVALPEAPLATTGTTETEAWRRILDEHAGLVDQIHADSTWARAVADHARDGARALRLITITGATTAGGRSRAQAAAQAARVAAGSTKGAVTAYAVGVEATETPALGPLVAHLLTHPDAAGLAGAELVAGSGFVGLRSHPRPVGSVSYPGPAVPGWIDGVLEEMIAP